MVWANHGNCSFMIIQLLTAGAINKIRSVIIERFGGGNVYVTENIRETRTVANGVFNSNSIHFLNNAKPTRYKKSYGLMESYKNMLEEKHRNKNFYIIDSSMVLAMYGIRPAADLDYYTIDPLGCIWDKGDKIEEHDSVQKSYYDDSIDNLVLSPQNYFMFNELKFVTLEKLLGFKKRRFENRHDLKDKYDIRLINMLIKGNCNRVTKVMLLLSISYERNKQAIRNMIKRFLVYCNLYGLLKKSKKE